jgi:hypothetical protein
MSPTEAQVSATIEATRKVRGLRPEAVCVAAGMSRASYYSRLTSGGWRLAELERVAELLEVPLVELVSGGSSSA